MFVPRSLQTTSHSAVLVPAAALCLGLLGWSRGTDDVRANDVAIGFAHGNRARTATMVIPDGAPPAAGWPVVLLIHGAGGSGDQMVRRDGWRDVAMREHFVVIAPDGTPADESRRARFASNMRTWNSGAGGGLATTGTSAYSKGVDDVDYLLALLDTTAQRVRIDPKRVYVAGHSNGGGMSYRVAAQHPERFAAVGVMAGHLFAAAPGTLSSSLSLIQIVGDMDPLMPFDGGEVRNGAGGTSMLRPALDAPTRWAAMNGITAAPRVIRDDSITVRQWGPSAAGAVVVSNVVKGHGHGWLWPGADRMPERLIGPRRDALNATESMWAFFAAHPRK